MPSDEYPVQLIEFLTGIMTLERWGGCLGRALSISQRDKSTPLRCSQDLLIPSYSRSLVLSFLLIWPILCARRSPRKRPGTTAQESDHLPRLPLQDPAFPHTA